MAPDDEWQAPEGDPFRHYVGAIIVSLKPQQA
jgi:hypothetical protein